MIRSIRRLLIPRKSNKYQPHITSHPGLTAILVIALLFQTTINIFASSSPSILGFATSIYQQELINLTNKERANNGLQPLTHNTTLDEAARLKALHMFEEDYWAHISPSGVDPWHWFEVAGYDYQSAGENLARDFDTSDGVVAAWMASPSHRENIVYPTFTEIGMAVVNGNLLGEDTTLVVQLFGTPPPQASLVFTPQTIEPNPADTLAAVPNTPVPTVMAQPTPAPTVEAPTPTPTVIPTVVPTNTPVPTLVPTIVLNQEQDPPNRTSKNENPELVIGQTDKNDIVPPNSLVLAMNVIKSVNSFSLNRIFTILMISSLIGLFAIDSYIHLKRDIKRQNAHRMIHVGILFFALISVIYGASGVVL